MISVICVYHNKTTLHNILLSSLEAQTAKHEIILIDNTASKYTSAASALNYGAKQATGKYLMFVHQDVELDSPTWLFDTEKLLDSFLFGIAGPIGVSTEGNTYNERLRGVISNCGENFGNPIFKPEPVQTLDECLAIIPRQGFHGFDARAFDGWHSYVSDYCLNCLSAFAIPTYVYHRSLATNLQGLALYHHRLYQKHSWKFHTIYMTTGTITRLSDACYPIISKLRPNYHKLFPTWIDTVAKEVKGSFSLLDIGCGYNSPVQSFPVRYKVGVEVFEPYLIESRKKGIHQKYIESDIRNISFPPDSFDIIFASEVLEHLSKEDGRKLLAKMTLWAKHKVIITTPNGYVHQDGYDANPFQNHLSGWTPAELQSLGFKVQGMNGLKYLHGYKGEIKFKSPIAWTVISDMTQRVVKYVPTQAFQLLAIKTKKGR
jgi:hypothetical protein